MYNFYSLVSVLFGLMVGSFANVCIYRLPRNESIIKPWSHCPSCGKAILWYDNIPLLSFLFLGGKCRTCKEHISLRYPLVEALTAFLFLMSIKIIGPSLQTLVYWYFFTLLIIATFTDFEHLIIPDVISIPGIVIGLLVSFIFPEIMKEASHKESLIRSLTGLIAGGGAIWSVGVLGKAIFHKDAMGGGDVKLMAMVGSFLGIKLALLTIFLGSFFGAFVGGILILLRLKTRRDYIPFGPYLALGGVLSFFFGDKLLRWYFGLLA